MHSLTADFDDREIKKKCRMNKWKKSENENGGKVPIHFFPLYLFAVIHFILFVILRECSASNYTLRKAKLIENR